MGNPSLGKSIVARTLPGVSWLAAERIVSLVSALLVGIAVARHLGPGDFGNLTFVLSFAAILLPVSAAGLAEVVTKELIERPDRHGAVMGTVLAIRKSVGLAITALFGLYCWLGPFPDDATRAYAFALVALAIAGDASVFRNWFIANDELPRFAAMAIVRTVVFALLRLALVVAGADLQAFVVAAGAELASAWLFAWVAWRRAEAPRSKFALERALVGDLLGRCWPLALSAVAAVVNLKIDIVLLATLTSPEETGYYGAAARLSEIWYVVPGLLMTALFPSLVSLRRDDRARYGELLQSSLDLLGAIAMAVAVLTAFAAPLIVAVAFGSAFAPAAPILAIHIWAGLFVFMRAVASKWMIAEGLLLASLYSHGAGAIVNVLLNLVLIPRFGGLGAAWATLLSYAIAGYFAFALFPQTREIFLRMSAAFLWPLRARRLYARLQAAR